MHAVRICIEHACTVCTPSMLASTVTYLAAVRVSHFEAQPQRLYSKLLFAVFLTTISPGTGESHFYSIITFRSMNFLQLAADVASLNIVQILHT